AVLIDFTDVAGVEPALGVDRISRGRLVAPVSGEDEIGLEQQLAVVGDANRGPADRRPDGPDAQRIRAVDADAGRRFGEAVPLVDGEADTAEEMAQPGTERCSSGDSCCAPAPEGRATLAGYQPVEDGVLELERQGYRAVLQSLRVADRDSLGHVEDLALAVSVRLLPRRVVDLLEDARDAQDECRLEGGQVRDQVLDVGGVAERAAGGQRADLDHATEYVRDREEQQGRGVLVEKMAQLDGDLADLGDEVQV